MKAKLLISNWDKDLFFFNVDIVSVMIVEGRANPPDSDFILAVPLNNSSLSFSILIMNEKVCGFIEMANIGGELSFSFC